MVKLIKHEKRIVLDGGLVAEVGEALAASANAMLDRASDFDGASVLDVMDQIMGSIGEVAIGPISEAVKAGLARWTPHLRHEGNVLHMTLANEGMVAEVNRYLVEAGVPVYGLQRDRLSLEELFLQIVGEESSA